MATGWCQTHYHRYWRTGTTGLRPKELRTDLTYRASHARVERQLGPAHLNACVACGGEAKEWAYDGTDESELFELIGGRWPVKYSVWPEFYKPMCFPCHRLMDSSVRAAKRTHCINGHEMTKENTYTRPSRPRTRECKECKRAEASARHALKRIAPIHLKENK